MNGHNSYNKYFIYYFYLFKFTSIDLILVRRFPKTKPLREIIFYVKVTLLFIFYLFRTCCKRYSPDNNVIKREFEHFYEGVLL